MIKSVEDLDSNGKSVFVRADFNIPLAEGKIAETHAYKREALCVLRFAFSVSAGLWSVVVWSRGPAVVSSLPWSRGPVVRYSFRALRLALCAILFSSDGF